MTAELEELLGTLAERYGQPIIAQRTQGVRQTQPISIGFLGEFSSGKSTLINALIGRKVLPAMVKPTSGAMVTVIPTEGIDKLGFFRTGADGSREPIDATCFAEIATGEIAGEGVLEVPATGEIPVGIHLIDTPGLQSLNDLHADITFGLLPTLDGAVFCHHASKGNLPGSLLSFLARPAVKPLLSGFVFVLTHADTVPAKDLERARAACVKDLVQLFEIAGLPTEDVDSRVVTAAPLRSLEADPHYPLQGYLQAHARFFVRRADDLRGRRRHLQLLDIARDLLAALQQQRAGFDWGKNEYEAAVKSLEEDRAELTAARRKEQDRLLKLGADVQQEMAQLGQSWIPRYADAAEQELPELSQALPSEIQRALVPVVQRHFEDLELPPFQGIGDDLQRRIAKISKVTDVATTAATAIAVAILSSGTSLAANAGEAAAGAAARTGGELAAGTAAAEAAIVAPEGVVATPILKRVLAGVGTLIHDINPLNLIGDLVSQPYKRDAAEECLRRIGVQVTASVMAQAERVLNSEIFESLENRQCALESAMRELQDNRRLDMNARAGQLENLESDIGSLQHALETSSK